MSMLAISDIAPMRLPAGQREVRTRRNVASRGRFAPTRRDFLRGTAIAATGVGLMSLGIFPPARRAVANHGAWLVKNDCSGLDFAQNDNCDGCDSSGNTFGCCGAQGYHQDQSNDCHCRHRPNDCKDTGDPPTDYDGWYWRFSGCCVTSCSGGCICRANQRWRCTDGYKRPNCSNPDWGQNVCRVKVDTGVSCVCPS